MKILILLLYFERPNLVRNALRSVRQANQHHPDWELVVIDDGSRTPVLPIVDELLGPWHDRVSVIETRMSADDKRRCGCLIGLAMNQAIRRSDAEAGIMLCDDDALYPTYLRDLSRFFAEQPDALSCYSRVIPYDAQGQLPEQASMTDCPLNRHTGPICGAGQVDASQGAWRLRCNKEYGVWFDSPRSRNHDEAFYAALYRACGPMLPTGVIGQYKGLHGKALAYVGPERAWAGGDLDRPPLPDEESPAASERQRFFVVSGLLPAGPG